MKDFAAVLALPASLLSIIASSTVHAQYLPWPYNLPRTARYYPEDEAHIKRNVEVQEKLAWQPPTGVKKMSGDEGEKFFLDYWGFDGTLHQFDEHDGGSETLGNLSIPPFLRPAIAPHTNHDRPSPRLLGRNIFERDYKCPAGTKSCSSIGQGDLCCELGETCVSTSSGVGCCPSGSTCGGGVSGCDTGAGYTSCPNSPNGGCCIPGAVCEGTGCIFYGTETVTMTLETETVTTGASFRTETSSGRTVTVAYPTTKISAYTTTKTVTASVLLSTGSTCTSGFFSCPVSLGGGCCRNGQGCATDTQCSEVTSTTTVKPGAPILPTSQSISAATVKTTTAVANCPTGFYMCSAVYLGGCCRVGRDCHTTSCPPQDTKTLISSGRTIYVTGAGGAAATGGGGSCANGWFSCPALDNGGCCPSGYQCGQASCIATNPGQKKTAKQAPSSANVLRWAWGFLGLGIVAAVGMIWL